MFGGGAFGEFGFGEATGEAAGDEIQPSSIISEEAFDSPVVSGTVAIIGAGDIDGAEAFGSPSLYELVFYKPVSRIR